MPDLVFELGCEELPASAVRQAYEDLARLTADGLQNAGLGFDQIRAMGTPRRLILGIDGIDSAQSDKSVESRGPAVGSAYDADGNPTKALEGFCRGQGVTPADLEQKDGYVWANKQVKGRQASEVLAEVVPAAVDKLTFDKTMRWGTDRQRFVRPVRWVLAVLDGATVPMTIKGVASGNTSRGHRFEHPEPFEVTSYDDLLAGLRQRSVEPDPAVRERTIREHARQATSGSPELPDHLVDENVFLTESPACHEGSFKDDYLVLPDAVLVTAMAKHERFFPVRADDGTLLPKFVSVRNGGEEAKVRAGNEWVLNARFNDALFFYEEDAKKSLDEFLDSTSRMLFQDKLGTVRQRADRLAGLATHLAVTTESVDPNLAGQAGLYAKADLSCGLVSELSSLQGVIGGAYAEREHLAPAVCHAIATQYNHQANLPVDSEEKRLGAVLAVVDQTDKLVGFLGIGLVPKGSSDPFALRRAATVLIETAWGWEGHFPDIPDLMVESVAQYRAQGVELDTGAVIDRAADVARGRYEALTTGTPYDVLESVLEVRDRTDLLRPRKIATRLLLVEELYADKAFVQTATRPLNILAAARKKNEAIADPIDVQKLDSAEGEALAHAVDQVLASWTQAAESGDVIGQGVSLLKSLEGPINSFFDSTMVMAEDPEVRAHRLGLLQKVESILLDVADWTKIVITGE